MEKSLMLAAQGIDAPNHAFCHNRRVKSIGTYPAEGTSARFAPPNQKRTAVAMRQFVK
ncbi:MAG TPA: hypothetical protein PKJ47_07515 [Candidatus Limiplasma sp.]|nr:hypothetical protein [Candidatus Limiplasma sp.]